MGRPRKNASDQVSVKKEQPSLTQQLASFDDILTDTLVDKVYYWTTIRKNRSKYNPTRGISEEAVTSILLHNLIVAKDFAKTEAALLDLPGLKKFYNSLDAPRQQDEFRRHMKSYIDMWRCDCPFDVSTTNRYTIVTYEAAVTARRHIKKGEHIKYLVGNLRAMTAEEAEDLDLTRRDFSVVMSSRKKTPSLFLGPARFANHDCKANARLVHRGADHMFVIAAQDIPLGTEITVDYGNHYFGEDNDECLCKTCEDNHRGGWSEKEREDSDDDSTSDSDGDSASDASSSAEHNTESDEAHSAASSFTSVESDGEHFDESPVKKRKLNSRQAPSITISDQTLTQIAGKMRFSGSMNRTSQYPVIEDIMVDVGATQSQPARALSLKNVGQHSRLTKRQNQALTDARSAIADSSIMGVQAVRKAIDKTAQSFQSFRNTSDLYGLSRFDSLSSKPLGTNRKRNVLASHFRSLRFLGESAEDHKSEVEEDKPIDWETCGKPTLQIHRRYRGLNPDEDIESQSDISSRDGRASILSHSSSSSSFADDTVMFPIPRQTVARRGRPRKYPILESEETESSQQPATKITKPRKPRNRRWIPQAIEVEIPSIRKPGDYIRTHLLLGESYSRWVECRTCDDVWVQANGYQTRKECPRCERHSKLYGYQWPKTDKVGKHDDEERVMDHRTVHRFLRPDEEKEERKRGRGLLDESTGADESEEDEEEEAEGNGRTESRSRGERAMREVQRVAYTR